MFFFFFCVFLLSSYIGGSESEGHFSLINEACSMLVRYGTCSALFSYLFIVSVKFYYKLHVFSLRYNLNSIY